MNRIHWPRNGSLWRRFCQKVLCSCGQIHTHGRIVRGEECGHRKYRAMQNLLVAILTSPRDLILDARMSNVQFFYPHRCACSLRRTIIDCCPQLKDFDFYTGKRGHILFRSVDETLQNQLLECPMCLDFMDACCKVLTGFRFLLYIEKYMVRELRKLCSPL